MNIQINGWDDNYNFIRKQIIRDVINIMYSFFKNEALYQNDLEISNIYTVSCVFADDNPCTHFDRSRICISSTGSYWCQFVHQLSHELCHCSTSRIQFPQSIKWFDEFICCCSTFLVEKFISTSTNGEYNYMFGDKTAEIFRDYLEIKQVGHIYQAKSTKEFFAIHREQYEANQNLIKNHDVFVYEFFCRIGQTWGGLSFIGKMWKVKLNKCCSIEEYLSRLSNICNSEENRVLNIIREIFGIKLNL
ncbi:MAG: hypothetical protein J6V71_00410 [Clostridia bacterium]|nr:hypothetical protein [Clostridia bacterium]